MSSPIPTRYLANTSAALGLFIVANNIYGAINPRGALNMLGFPIPASPGDQKLVLGLTRMQATTRIALGASTLAMWNYGCYRAMGLGGVVGVLMAVVDG